MNVFIFFVIFGATLALPFIDTSIDWRKLSSKNLYAKPRFERPETKIVGGEEAVPHSRPYQAVILIDGVGVCGGSLITPNYVLTAAHCAFGASYFVVKLGAHNISETESSQVTFTSSNYTVHEDYPSTIYKNDLALIRLPSPAQLNENVQTVSLAPKNSSDFSGDKALLSGWGKTTGDSDTSSVLMNVNLTVITNQQCEYEFFPPMDFSMLCTSGLGPKGGCNGDSGGPLTVDNVQIGVVSFGDSKCTVGNPTVFTRVSSFRDWLEENSDIGSYL